MVEAGIGRYFLNSVIVTVGAVIPIVLFSFLASYAIVRGDSRLLRFSRTLFLLGLAIPLQATIIPIYLIITRIHMYDSLGALILPSIAFGIPLTVLILSNFIRDVPRELFESMRLDGCTDWQMAWKLAFPLTRPAIVTVSIYNGLNVWNGFLFALILTQSPEKRVMPLALWAFQGEYQVNIPAVLAAVVLSTLPILILYIARPSATAARPHGRIWEVARRARQRSSPPASATPHTITKDRNDHLPTGATFAGPPIPLTECARSRVGTAHRRQISA